MWALIVRIWGALKRLVGLVVPFVGGVREHQGWSTAARWTVRLILIALLVVGLYFLSEELEIRRGVKAHSSLVQKWWLPVLGLLVLGLLWLGWYLWKLLTEEDASDFPDIDQAWDEATAALGQAGIDPARVPVFLVLGQTAGGEDRLFEAALPSSSRPLRVRGAPRRLAPLHVYATEDAVYVTCARASVLGRQASRLGRGEAPSASASVVGASAAVLGRSARQTIFQTMQPGGQLGEVQKILARAAKEKRALTAEEQAEMHRLMGGDGSDSFAPQARPAKPSYVRDEAEIEEHAARLHHLGRLIARARQPELPVRGVLVLLPWAATETDELSNVVIEACRRDLAALREAVQVVCPHIALVSDLETAPGFSEFLEHFDEKLRRTGRVGRSFPLAPDPRGLSKLLDAGMERFCAGEFSTWVYEFFGLETAEGDDRTAITEANVNLYQLLVQLQERRRRLSRILAHGLAGADPSMLAGCYLAGTGAGAGEQAFVAAVFHRLLKERESVSWTDEALAADAGNRLWGTYGLVAVGVIAAALAVAAGYVFARKG